MSADWQEPAAAADASVGDDPLPIDGPSRYRSAAIGIGIEALRAFAMVNGEFAFANLCTEALSQLADPTGEQWAIERIVSVLAEVAYDTEWCAANSGWVGNTLIATQLAVIRATDTTRPD